MKFISDYPELKGKVYGSINECKEAETKIDAERVELEKKQKDASKLKKKLADDIDTKEAAVKKAYEDYDAAMEKARIILEESNKEVAEIIKSAKKDIKDAEEAKANAIKEFNKQCGPYQKVYTGKAAEEEFNRIEMQMGSMLADLLKRFF